MFGYNILGQFLLSFIIGVICFILILIQGKEKIKKDKTYVVTICFVADIMLLGLVYSIMYTREIILFEYDANLALRWADYIFYAGMMVTWVLVLEAFAKTNSKSVLKMPFRISKVIGICGTVMFLFFTTCYMDNNYYIRSDVVRTYYHGTEVCYSLLAAGIIIWCTICAVKEINITNIRRCVNVISAMLTIYYVIEIRSSINLGEFEEISWTGSNFNLVSLKGWALVIAVVFTAYFILKNDFQALFNEPLEVSERDSLQKCIDRIAKSHRLTQREREIVELIYKGASNADIADELYISLNTVKSHLKNIFEKLNVHSRMELVYLVNAQNFWNDKYLEEDYGS